LRLAIQAVPYSGLIAIAEHKGFFRQEGLDVSITQYPCGADALAAVCGGREQVATAADAVFAWRLNDQPEMRIIASIGLVNSDMVVARKGCHIEKPSDLRGKKIGYAGGTSTEYYLDSFLLLNNISPGEVTAVSIPPLQQVRSLAQGGVDAIAAFDTQGFEAKERLGAQAVSWDAQNNLDFHWVLAVKDDMLKSPGPLRRLVKALVHAERFYLANPEKSQTIISERFALNPELTRELKKSTRLCVTLDQPLITSLENFSEWKMHKEQKEGELPDFLECIYVDALDEVAPAAVTIFR
jgi:NitT/TauT family transport system substrate-binding protein